MKVLVTGAAGFIGQHVIQALREAGHYTIALDLFTAPANLRYELDITKPLHLGESIDAVIHLAAVSHPRDCDNNPTLAFNVNVNGTHQVLKMALASGAKKVVFASSAHVYGISPRYLPTPESHSLWLQNTYTISKILGEQLCALYFENHGLSYTTLRLFNAYGNGQALGYFVPDQIEKAKAGRIDLQGSNVTKDWIYVTDVAEAFIRALSTDFVGPINVGTGVETNLGDIAQMIAKAYQVQLDAHPVAVPTRMCADIARAKRVLGWCPKVDLEHGIRNILDVTVGAVAPPA